MDRTTPRLFARVARLVVPLGALVLASCGSTPEETEQARGLITGVPLVVAMTVAFLVVAGGLIFGAVALDRYARSRRDLETAGEAEPAEEDETEIAGIGQGSAGVPRWLYAAYVIIPVWAAAFIITNVQVASEIQPPPEQTEQPAEEGGLVISAVNIQFDKDELTAPPNTEVTLTFENNDAGIPHNVAVYRTEAAADAIFVGELFNGVKTEEYVFTTPEVGEYYFRCDVHPAMDGAFVVTEEAAGGGDAAAGGAAVEITAKSLKFDVDRIELTADAEVEITLVNEDAGIPHNVAIYATEAASEEIFVGELFNGVATETYTFTAPPAGEYYFRCDVHPSMEGTAAFS